MGRKTSTDIKHSDDWIKNVADVITKERITATLFIERDRSTENDTYITFTYANKREVIEVGTLYEGTRAPLAVNLAIEQIAEEIAPGKVLVIYATNAKRIIEDIIDRGGNMSRRTSERLQLLDVELQLDLGRRKHHDKRKPLPRPQR
ncbi:hypothetical protein ACWV26_17740 [Rummeliibacillus sp. JY-2-4R]